MLTFKPITIRDKEIIRGFTYPSSHQNCDFAFSNMCSWRFLYDSEYTIHEGFLLIRFFIEEKGKRHKVYMFPIGEGDFKQIIEVIEQDSKADNHPLYILGVTPKVKSQLEQYYPGDFLFLPERDYFDYIYFSEDLKHLKGKKFQPKRNHINRFKKKYSYTYQPITPEIVPLCLELECKWCRANLSDEYAEDLKNEQQSMIYALNHFDELGLLGGAIVVENEIVAFTYGSPINYNTLGVHVEKADVQYEGVFSLINQEFALHIPDNYIYINREEDLGIPGLRQAKLSYHPTILLEKSTAIKRR